MTNLNYVTTVNEERSSTIFHKVTSYTSESLLRIINRYPNRQLIYDMFNHYGNNNIVDITINILFNSEGLYIDEDFEEENLYMIETDIRSQVTFAPYYWYSDTLRIFNEDMMQVYTEHLNSEVDRTELLDLLEFYVYTIIGQHLCDIPGELGGYVRFPVKIYPDRMIFGGIEVE